MKIKTLFYTTLFLLATTSLFAAQATLSWDMNSEEDLAGYKIYYGNTISRDYDLDLTIDVGNVTSHTVTDLVEGEIYFFAATAYDFSSNESGYSNEVSYDVPITMPVLTLLGSNSMTVERGTAYSDPGATAFDEVDGDLTKDIAITGNVDTLKIGTYIITYTVSDSSGNIATMTRTVTVEDTTAPVWNGDLMLSAGNEFTWNAPEGEVVAYFKVYKKSSKFPNRTDVYITTSTSFRISGKNKERQEYIISWVSELSGTESNKSEPLCIRYKGRKVWLITC